MCAALGNQEEDHWEWHMFDTIKGGDYLVDQDAAEILAREAVETVIELEHMGLPFNRTPDGKIDQRRFGGHTRNYGEGPVRRSCFAADRTGHMILQTLYQQAIKHGVRFYDEYHVVDLLTEGGDLGDGGRAAGVVAYRIADGSLHTIRSKATMLATGGFGRMFRITSNAWSLTGDGVALAYRHGVPMQDMEFYQFHPTGIVGIGILLSEAARGEGGILLNGQGERFMERYAPTMHGPRPRATWSAGASTRRSGPAAASMARTTSTSTSATSAARSSRRSCPTSPTSPGSTRASSRSPSPCPSSRPRTTRWAACRPMS